MFKKIVKTIIAIILILIAIIIVGAILITPTIILYRISTIHSWFIVNVWHISEIETLKRNLRRAFPNKGNAEIKKIATKCVEGNMDFIIEYFKKTIYCEHQIKKHCKFTNLELLYEKFQNHKFILCYGGHMLNFELLISLPLHTKEYGMCQLYLGNTKQKGKIAKWIQQNREKYGAICIPTSSPIKTLLNLKNEMDLGKSSKKGYLFGTLADYDTLSDDIHVTTLFNKDFEVVTGSERIGRKFNMAFLYAHIRRTKRGFYEVEFKELNPTDLATNPYAYTDEFVRLLEANIKESPELWLQWSEPRF